MLMFKTIYCEEMVVIKIDVSNTFVYSEYNFIICKANFGMNQIISIK